MTDTATMYAAFIKAQAAFPPVKKRRTASIPTKGGGSYSYKYADLADILDAVTGPLRENGFGLVQSVSSPDGAVGITTRLLHVSGGVIESDVLALPSGGGSQAAGSAITYARRYSLSALLGIATEDDVDGRQPANRTSGGGAAGGADSGPPGNAGSGSAKPDRPLESPPPDTPSGTGGEQGGTRAAPTPSVPDTDGGTGGVGAADAGTAQTPPPARHYPVDPGQCTHRYPSGNWLPWDADDRCPKCGTPKITAVEGTTADLGPPTDGGYS